MNTAADFQLDNKYIIQAELGRGGMGIVYRGFDTVLQRPVAIKVLAPPLSQDAEAITRFRQEAVAAANLQHPNIVTIHAVGEVNGYYYIVMELLEGAPLDKWLAGRGPLPLAQAQHILRQLAAALDYAHQRQLVHRDVKPANVMLAANGRATLMDFGLVRAAAGGDGRSTGGGGTPTYMAPEQILGAAVDGRADIYALGVILYEMATGQAPFAREAPLATAYAHLSDAPRPPRQLRADLPAPAEAVILKALAKKPDDRFARAGDLAAAFALACNNQWPAGFKPSPTPPPKKQPTPAPQPMRSRPPLPWLAFLIALLAVVVGGLAWVLMRPAAVIPSQPSTFIADGSPAASDTPAVGLNDARTAPPFIASPIPPPTALVAPTNTLAPTPTHTPTARATPAPATATATQTTSPPATPILLEPAEGLQVTGNTTFVWSWMGQLADNQAFEVHLWQDGAHDHLTAAGAEAQSAGGDRWQQRIDVSQTAAVRAAGAGAYWWTVAVVDTNPYVAIGAEAPPRRLTVK